MWNLENHCLKRKTTECRCRFLTFDRYYILVNHYVLSEYWYEYDTFTERDKKILGRL